MLWVKPVSERYLSSHTCITTEPRRDASREEVSFLLFAKGESEFLVLKSAIVRSRSRRILLRECQVMALERTQAPSVSTACALCAMLCSGMEGCSLRDTATPATASAAPARSRAAAGRERLATARCPAERGRCQEKGRCTSAPQYSNWVSRTKPVSRVVTHPQIRCTASWGQRQTHKLFPGFGEII